MPELLPLPYTFTDVQVVSVHDGDTATFLMRSDPHPVFLGISTLAQIEPPLSARLRGMAARELKDPGGPEAGNYLAGLLAGYTGRLGVTVPSWDKYGKRYDAIVWTPDGWVHDLMIAAGYALPWDGKGPQPKPPWPIPHAHRL